MRSEPDTEKNGQDQDVVHTAHGGSPNGVRETRIIGLAEVLKAVRRIAETNMTVLITGASGTGKELVARYVHEQSKRHDGPFVALNAGVLPENLAEAELFGHERGAFTGAVRSRQGLFREADNGTIFLDEIGHISRDMQVKFLRILEERMVRPVGSNEIIPVNVRVVAATNSDLEGAVAAGNFREDLFYRLNGFRVELPPLKERSSDEVRELIEYFAANNEHGLVKIDSDAMAQLLAYPWPGNVRELENVILSAAVMCDDSIITPKDLPAKVRTRESSSAENSLIVTLESVSRDLARIGEMSEQGGIKELQRILAKYRGSDGLVRGVEKALMMAVLHFTRGHRARAAEILEVKRTTLVHRIKAYGLDDPGFVWGEDSTTRRGAC